MPEENRQKTRIGLKIISVILSLLLWFYVTNQGQQSTVQNTLEAPVIYTNIPANLTVVGPETVMVRLWGAFREAGSVTAYADLSDLTIGEYEVTVHVKPVKGAMFTSVQPDKIKVRLENIKERLVRISSEVKENPTAGYQIVEISTSPENCMVRGEQGVVARVASVVAPVQLGNVTDITTQKVSLQARDTEGNLITEGITLVPRTVDVYVAVEQQKEIKKVTVKAILQGQVSPDYQLGTVTVEPEEISLLALQGVLDNLVEVETQAVDLKDRTNDFFQTVPIVLPEGVIGTPTQVLVRVKIGKLNNEEGKP